MPSKKDLTGVRFGKLVVVKQGDHEGRNVAWVCVCDCGKTATVTTGRLRSGNTKSCGCGKFVGLEPYHQIKHGKCGSAEHRIWKNMVQRCTNPNNHAYHKYGGRGIKVCDRWRTSFAAFLADMGPKPDGKSIDRIDNNGPYSPENCRWATPFEQGANTRQNRWLTAHGVTKHLTDWARLVGVCPSTISKWVRKGVFEARVIPHITVTTSEPCPFGDNIKMVL